MTAEQLIDLASRHADAIEHDYYHRGQPSVLAARVHDRELRNILCDIWMAEDEEKGRIAAEFAAR